MYIFAPDFDAWSFHLSQGAGCKEFVTAVNGREIDYPAPEDWEFRSLKFPFAHDKYSAVMKMKTGKDGKNLINLEPWLEHPPIKAMVENTAIIDEIIYYDKVDGNEITPEQAFANTVHMDPAKKPPSNRPGKKRKLPEETPPAPATPNSSAASSANTPDSVLFAERLKPSDPVATDRCCANALAEVTLLHYETRNL